jgi:Rrf2 family transcriptional regulator, cysteine metabolism repressor
MAALLHISTRGEYGVRVMIDLARHFESGLRSLTEISEDEGLPVQYLEQLIKRLRDKELVASVRGAHGGYQLTRTPADIRMSEVLQALEGSLETYSCPSDKDAQGITCDWGHSINDCTTRMLWAKLRTAIFQTLDSITLAELSAVPAHSALKGLLTGGALA